MQQQMQAQARVQSERIAAMQSRMERSLDGALANRIQQDPAYEGPPDWTVLRINADAPLPEDPLRTVIGQWLQDVSGLGEWELHAMPQVGRRPENSDWTVHFCGDGKSAAKSCQAAASSLRLPGGAWKRFFVEGQQIYISRDRSPKQRRLDLAGKRLLEAIAVQHPHLRS
eukprot:8052084-Karenia_brevis.AAC.1